MKLCPTCQNKYPDDANFCPREECASAEGPRRLVLDEPPPSARFVPVSRIGGGASGEVWQSSDAQSGAAVAYKVIAAEVLPTVAALERAQRELRQLQRAKRCGVGAGRTTSALRVTMHDRDALRIATQHNITTRRRMRG